jgi:hypothetical protein
MVQDHFAHWFVVVLLVKRLQEAGVLVERRVAGRQSGELRDALKNLFQTEELDKIDKD